MCFKIENIKHYFSYRLSHQINKQTGKRATIQTGKITRVLYSSIKILAPVVDNEPKRFTKTKLKLYARLRFSILLCAAIMLLSNGMKDA